MGEHKLHQTESETNEKSSLKGTLTAVFLSAFSLFSHGLVSIKFLLIGYKILF
ncbi:hypothetical protein [Bacillus cereus]|uniref:hypothetical protein n=1 Tax=Bacillus cereus TaxID=1396 RepID=UPI000319612E